jgi:outer membrane protein OmpA-like peptidoglycan-associated protein
MNEEGSLSLVPELFAGYVFTAPVEGYDWSILNFRGGVSVRYTFNMAEDEVPVISPLKRDTIYKRDTLIVEVENEPKPLYRKTSVLATGTLEDTNSGKPVIRNEVWIREIQVENVVQEKDMGDIKPQLDLSITAVGLNEKGEENEIVEMRLIEYTSSEIRPLLPYVFFDEGSSKLNEEYKGKSMDLDNIYAPWVYYKVLDTVANRAIIKNLDLVLLGSYVEGESQSLARERAESVQKRLIDLGVRPERISLKTEKQTYRDDEQDNLRRAEGRRVEIVSSRGMATDVVILNDTVVESNPPSIKLYPRSDKMINGKWSVSVSQDRKNLRYYEGVGKLPNSLVWNVEREGEKITGTEGELEIRLEANSDGGSSAASNTIPFKQTLLTEKKQNKENGYVIGRYELILFDFGSAELSLSHKDIIAQVKGELSPKSIITIEGYTDMIGENDINENLASQRAQATAELFMNYKTETRAIGEKVEFYDNSRPEGRMYSRTVRITTKTPIK